MTGYIFADRMARRTWLLLTLALLLAPVLSVPAQDHSLYGLQDFRAVDRTEGSEGDGLQGAWQRQDDGTVVCRLGGTVTGRRRWLIPADGAVRAECSVAFHVSSENIDVLPGRANLAALLERREPAPDDPRRDEILALPKTREVPLYVARAPQHQELGRREFSTRNGDYRFAGFLVELSLRQAGPASLTLHKLTVSFETNLPTDTELERILGTPPGLVASVARNSAGNLELRVNDEPMPEIGYFHGQHATGAGAAKLQAVAGVRLRRVAINMGGPSPYFRDAAPVWTASGYLDTDAIAQRLAPALAQADSRVIVDVVLTHPPSWWPELPQTPYPYISDVDPEMRAWRRRALRLLLAQIRQLPDGERVIGCHLVLGLGMNEMAPPNRDRSPAYAAAFRDWLKGRYADDATLRQAWDQPQINLRDAQPAPASRWPKGALGGLRRPDENPWGLDSYRFYNESWVASILDLANTVKRSSGRRYVVGVSGGPALALKANWQNRFSPAPWALQHLLNSPNIDLLEVPAGHLDRRLGEGSSGDALLLADTARNRGKMLWLRQDLTALPAWSQPESPASRMRDLLAVHRRDFAAALRANAGIWLWQPRQDTLDDQQVLQEIRAEIAVLAKLRGRPRSPSNDVAFVVDPELALVRGPDPGQRLYLPADMHAALISGHDPEVAAPEASRAWHLESMPRGLWARSGLGYDVVSLDDLQALRYRLVILHHTLTIDDETHKELTDARLGNRGQIWLWADGITDGQVMSPSLAARRSDMRLGMHLKPSRFDLKSAEALPTFLQTQSLDGYLGWVQSARQPRRSLTLAYAPRFFVTDQQATPLADWRDTGATAIAMKTGTDHTVYYSASPVLNPVFLRAAAREAGAHVYMDDDSWCLVDRRFVAVHAKRDGTHVIRLPDADALYEVFGGTELAVGMEHHLSLEAGTTYLFFRGPKSEYDAL